MPRGATRLTRPPRNSAERRGVSVEVDEDEAFPGFDSNGDEAVLRTIKILHALELRHAFQRTIEAVVPAVIGTMQKRGVAARLSYHRSGVMAANVVEGAQDAVVTTDDNDGLASNGCGNELSRTFHLIGARNELPRFAEHVQALQFRNARIDIPGGGNGGSLRERSVVVVTGEYLLD